MGATRLNRVNGREEFRRADGETVTEGARPALAAPREPTDHTVAGPVLADRFGDVRRLLERNTGLRAACHRQAWGKA